MKMETVVWGFPVIPWFGRTKNSLFCIFFVVISWHARHKKNVWYNHSLLRTTVY